jgi:hypothetical protein
MNLKRVAIAAVLAAAATTSYGLACGPWLTDYRTVETVTPPHREAFAKGNVGIVRPRFARRYLVQAYRRFSGQPPLPNLVGPLEPPDYAASPSPPRQVWLAWRRWTTAGALMRTGEWMDTDRRIGNYQTVRNCLDDAFVSAMRTGKARIAQWGGASAAASDWVKAQDAVFANCSGDLLVLPEPAPPGADALTRADRAYQTAAAYFYAMRFDEAAKRFQAIAADTTSPWRPYGRYLAARALIRQATIPDTPAKGGLAAAEAELRRVIEDPGAAALHGSARGLLDFIAARSRPLERLETIAASLSTGRAVTDQQIVDYQRLMDRLLGDTTEYEYQGIEARDGITRSGGLNDWVIVMQGTGAGAAERAVAQWTRTRGAPWLVAALWKLPADHAGAGPLLDAAAAIDRSSPAFATLAFLRVRLLAERGARDEARALLAGLPVTPEPGFEVETINLLAAERMKLAANLDELVHHATRTRVSEHDGVGSRPPAKPLPVFDDDAGVVFSQKLPLAMLVHAVREPTLPARLRLRVASAAFVRAVLLQRHDEARELAAIVRPMTPALGSDLDRFLGATTPANRHIAAVRLLLRTPGLRAGVWGLEDNQVPESGEPARKFDHMFRRNLWCSFAPDGPERRIPDSHLLSLIYPTGVPSPAFLSPAEIADVDRELTALAALGTAPAYLAEEAVKWAKARPRDQDAAEALAHAVEAGRWGCAEGSARASSRSAFQTLHRLFPKSEWARRTKYWY